MNLARHCCNNPPIWLHKWLTKWKLQILEAFLCEKTAKDFQQALLLGASIISTYISQQYLNQRFPNCKVKDIKSSNIKSTKVSTEHWTTQRGFSVWTLQSISNKHGWATDFEGYSPDCPVGAFNCTGTLLRLNLKRLIFLSTPGKMSSLKPPHVFLFCFVFCLCLLW